MFKLAIGLTARHCVVAALFALAPVAGLPSGSSPPGSAQAQPADAEKQAFEAAKDLGTVEAWDAFLSNYPKGFHADLARAYVKKLAEQPAAVPPPSASPAPTAAAPASYPMPAGSWGGIVRNGPGPNYAKVGSLQERDPVTLVEKTEVFENGFPWFKITYSGGGSGYQWGGILCAIGEARPELFQTCTTKAQRDGAREAAPQLCRDNGGEWGEGQCWPKGHYSSKTKKNKTGLSCKELKARCSRTDTDADCKRYLDSCTGHGDN
ncbi:MAG: SH3 domain-containing protein [Hyphomicrobium sp.]|nr:SH3 domain-containing protein [Hyphomicrobium sp.]